MDETQRTHRERGLIQGTRGLRSDDVRTRAGANDGAVRVCLCVCVWAWAHQSRKGRLVVVE
eukprot:6823594-Prymnesium_polylepis.3